MTVKLQTEHHLEFLSFKGGCTDSSESTLVKLPHCRKSHVAAQVLVLYLNLPFVYNTFSKSSLCLGVEMTALIAWLLSYTYYLIQKCLSTI